MDWTRHDISFLAQTVISHGRERVLRSSFKNQDPTNPLMQSSHTKYGQPAALMDHRCRHGRRTVVVCHCPPITWTAEENKTRAFTIAGIVKALIFYRMSCNRIHDYQLLSYSDDH